MKKFARVSCSVLLKLSLFTAAFAAALLGIFGSSEPIKKSLADNKLYDSLIENIVDNAIREGTGEDQNGAPADKKRSSQALKVAATRAFTPAFVQKVTEQALDSTYRWLNGGGANPDFQIDLSDAKTDFIAVAGREVEKYIDSLPVCTKAQSQKFDQDADPFSQTCRPPDLSGASIRKKLVKELKTNDDFFPEPVLTTDDLPRNEDGKTSFEQADGVRQLYAAAKRLPWIMLVFSALLAVGLLFLSETKRKGLKSVGVSLLGTGLFIFLTSWLGSFIFDQAAKPGGFIGRAVSENTFQTSILAVVRALNNNFNRTLLVYCVAYTVLGGLILLVLRFTKPKPDVSSALAVPKAATAKKPVA